MWWPAQTAVCVDMCLSGFTGKARIDIFYECIRERHVLEGLRQLLVAEFAVKAASTRPGTMEAWYADAHAFLHAHKAPCV